MAQPMRALTIAAILIAFAVGLAACQAPGEPATPLHGASQGHQPSPEEAERAARLLDGDFFDRLKDNTLERLIAVCADAVSVPSRSQCVHEAILTGFDETGEARRQCGVTDDGAGRIACYMFGSYGYNLARRQQPDLSADYDWNDPLASIKETMTAIHDQSRALCSARGSVARVERCVLEQFGAALSLSTEQISACAGMGDVKIAFHCELRSHLARAFEEALTRMTQNQGVGT